ncbi:unnamed protein product [Linum trigynum]|uniref:Aspartic peptidase DDI1-type domain-containing protein n=1 Tax=Linum trigynum TaxID=586398 RepID=A0AAV2EC65_9ROSI
MKAVCLCKSSLPVQNQRGENVKREELKPYDPPAPFPQRLMKPLEDPNFKKFVNLFKQLHINIPLAEALEKMPTYAKFLKELLTKKRKWTDLEKVTLTPECSVVIQNKFPEKREDLGSFTIPCIVGETEFTKSLCDLGAGINLMPYSVYKKLGLQDVIKPTRITLQLVDRSVKVPKGVVEHVLVKVGKFIFPADFVILEMEEDREVPLILGKPFLATGGALIDVQKGELTFRVCGKEVKFNVYHASKYPNDSSDVFAVDVIESSTDAILNNDYDANSKFDDSDNELDELIVSKRAQMLEALPMQVEGDEKAGFPKTMVPSRVQPPELELKPVPGHLKYRYLGKDFNLLVIIPSSLTLKQEEYLLEALQYHLRLTKGSNMQAKKVIPNFRTPGPAEVTHMLDGGYAFYHCLGGYAGYLSIPIG